MTLSLLKDEGRPAGRFSVIYADPPWSYNDTQDAGQRGAIHKYPTQPLSWIKGLGVRDLAAPNSLLFLWATFPLLAEGIQVVESWGFTYKTVAFVWVKTNKKAGTPFWGMGSWTRANAEVVLLGARGKPKRHSAGIHQILEADCPEAPVIHSPARRHSAKPPEIRERIVELAGDVPRLEMFARERADGWAAWGNQVPGGSDVHIEEAAPSAEARAAAQVVLL